MTLRFFVQIALIGVALFLPVGLGYGDELSFGNPRVEDEAYVVFPVDLSVNAGGDDSVAINLEITHSSNLVFHNVASSKEMIDGGKTVAWSRPSSTTVRVVIYDMGNKVIGGGALFNISFTPSDEVKNGGVVTLRFSEAVGAGDQAQAVSLSSTATFSKSIENLLAGLDPTAPDGDGDSGTLPSSTKEGGGNGGCFMGGLR